MCTRFVGRVIAAVVMLAPAYGQSFFDGVSFRTMSVGGIHLYGVSVFSGYSTSAYPGGFGQFPSTGAGQLGSVVNYGGSASLGWQYHRARTDVFVAYEGTYTGMTRYSVNAFSQNLSFAMNRSLTPRWSLTLSAAGSDTTTAEFIYQPSTVRLTSQTPATVDDLAAAFSVGQFSSSQAASTLTNAPVLESPARSLLLGDRILSYSGQISAVYSHSSRLVFHFGSTSAAGQRRFDNHTAAVNSVIPRSFGFNAGMGMSYQLSPRTQLGVDVDADRVINRYQKGYVTNATVSLGRKMSERWFLRVYGGGSLRDLSNNSYGASLRSNDISGGGSLGFRTFQHTLLGSYSRSASDTYGLALGTTSALSAAWSWHRPGSSHSVFSSFGQQLIRNTGYASLSGWQASAGIGQSLNAHMGLSVQYVYLSNSGTLLGTPSNFEIHSVRMSLSWSPAAGH